MKMTYVRAEQLGLWRQLLYNNSGRGKHLELEGTIKQS